MGVVGGLAVQSTGSWLSKLGDAQPFDLAISCCYEPALFWPPGGGVDLEGLVARRRHLDDPCYEAVMDLAQALNDGGGRRLPSHLRIAPRPDLAIRP